MSKLFEVQFETLHDGAERRTTVETDSEQTIKEALELFFQSLVSQKRTNKVCNISIKEV